MPESHEVHPVNDMAWTIPEERPLWRNEITKRQCTNLAIKDHLQRDSDVEVRASGWSMAPRVQDGDMCLYEPVYGEESILVGDVVFCQVWPGEQFFAQYVLSAANLHGVTMFDIGYCIEAGGGVVGYCTHKEIYGRLHGVVREKVR